MPERPLLRFFLADTFHPVVNGNEAWTKRLPQNRKAGAPPADAEALTCGAYFEAVSRFLARDNWCSVSRACAALESRWPVEEAPSRIDLFLEKHGVCYHPCRVVVANGGRRAELVVNVAVSPEGLALLPGEVELLQSLSRRFGSGHLPEVFASDEVLLADGRRLMMFLGQWFTGFHEFHLTATQGHDPALVVWTPQGPLRLDPSRRRALYRQAAAILAGFYDVFSGSQILGWHHAAGDFVVRMDEGQGDVAVRLVTVRRYGRLTEQPPDDLETALRAFTLFLVHTTLWLRLDRCDGIGELMWSGYDCVEAAVDGIFDAFQARADKSDVPFEMIQIAAAHLASCRRASLVETIMALAARRTARNSDPLVSIIAAEDQAECLQRVLEAKARPCRF